MIDAGNSATYGAISAAPTVSTLTLLSGRHPKLGGAVASTGRRSKSSRILTYDLVNGFNG